MMLDPHRIEVVDADMAAVLRAKTPAERTAIAADLWEYGRDVVLASVRRRNPGLDNEGIEREFLRWFVQWEQPVNAHVQPTTDH